MRKVLFLSVVVLAALAPFVVRAASPFVGRWDFNVVNPGGVGANWLGISESGGALEVWFQPTGGHVIQLKDVKAEGSHLILTVSAATDKAPAATWDLTASGGKLTGTQKRGDR